MGLMCLKRASLGGAHRRRVMAAVMMSAGCVLHGGVSAQGLSPRAADVGGLTLPGLAPRLDLLAQTATGGAATGTEASTPAAPAALVDDVPTELGRPGSGYSNLWYFQTSLYTRHFHPDDRHDNHQKLLNVEYWRDDSYLAGLALFHNSFGQPSQYVYIGKRWRPFDSVPSAYVKLTGGVLHGYKGEFKDKIPFNSTGYAPVILPAIGYSGKRFSTEVTLFGLNGLMWTVGVFLY